MNIIINNRGKFFQLDVESCDLVFCVKQKIEDKTNIKPSKQRLYFGSIELDDNQILSHYSIFDKNTLFLSEYLKLYDMQIFVRCINKTIVLDVFPHDTIETIKLMITEKEGIPSNIIRLSYGNIILKDNTRLEDYNIEKESTLNIFLRTVGN